MYQIRVAKAVLVQKKACRTSNFVPNQSINGRSGTEEGLQNIESCTKSEWQRPFWYRRRLAEHRILYQIRVATAVLVQKKACRASNLVPNYYVEDFVGTMKDVIKGGTISIRKNRSKAGRIDLNQKDNEREKSSFLGLCGLIYMRENTLIYAWKMKIFIV